MLQELIRTAAPSYTQRVMHAAQAPELADIEGQLPMVLFSHCDQCVRFAYFEMAEDLAKKGFIAVSVDHVNNTIYNYVMGNSTGVDLDDFLETRRLDIYAVTNAMLDAQSAAIPTTLRGRADKARIGMTGHSYGALTTAYASTRDARIRATAYLAMAASYGDNYPVMGDRLKQRYPPSQLSTPSLFIVASEDVGEVFGLNEIIRENYEDLPAQAWRATLRDTGHYSVCNICGIAPYYENGCGAGIRATRFLEPFTFLDIDTATGLTSALLTAFFEMQLNGESGTSLENIAQVASDVLTLEHRNP
jgi:predicted dienelactone hydrolase